MSRSYIYPLSLLLIIFLSFFLIFPDVKYDQLLTDEDGWLENITAIAFLVASIMFSYLFVKSAGNGNNFGRIKTKRNLVFLFLSLLFFIGFGEEISWGQRIFGWATPEKWSEINFQHETNIHNLDLFKFHDDKDESFWSFLFVFNAGRLFTIFWFTFLVLIPLLNIYSKWAHTILDRINVPIAPLWFGLLMIGNFIISKLFKFFTRNYPGDYAGSVDEVLETNYSLVIALLAYRWVSEKIKLSFPPAYATVTAKSE